MPRISIVTPSYNQGQFLRETIESVLNQNYIDYEFFIVDGGSTDGSDRIIREYSKCVDWCVSERDRGQADAIMKGLTRATGELFCWVNSDDILLPGCLRTIADVYMKYDKPDILTANVAYIDMHSRITRFIRVPKQSRFFFYRGVWHGTAPCVFFKCSSFMKAGGLNALLHLSMDLDVWMRLMTNNAVICHIPAYLGAFRWHEGAKTVKSLRSRITQENPETVAILDANLEGTTQKSRGMWRRLYKLYQILNFNYIRAYIDYRRFGGHPWHETFRSSR